METLKKEKSGLNTALLDTEEAVVVLNKELTTQNGKITWLSIGLGITSAAVVVLSVVVSLK